MELGKILYSFKPIITKLSVIDYVGDPYSGVIIVPYSITAFMRK